MGFLEVALRPNLVVAPTQTTSEIGPGCALMTPRGQVEPFLALVSQSQV